MVLLFSIIASVGTMASMLALAYKQRWGWLVSIVNQANWFVFIILTQAWGFIPLEIVTIGIAWRGWVKWQR